MTVCQAFPLCLLLWKLNCMQLKITKMLDPPFTCTQLLQIKDTKYNREEEKQIAARKATVLKIFS